MGLVAGDQAPGPAPGCPGQLILVTGITGHIVTRPSCQDPLTRSELPCTGIWFRTKTVLTQSWGSSGPFTGLDRPWHETDSPPHNPHHLVTDQCHEGHAVSCYDAPATYVCCFPHHHWCDTSPSWSPWSLASPSVSCCQALVPLGVYAMVSTMSLTLVTWISLDSLSPLCCYHSWCCWCMLWALLTDWQPSRPQPSLPHTLHQAPAPSIPL